MGVGFRSSEPVPSPKSHDQRVGVPSVASAKRTRSGAPPLVGVAVNSAESGSALTYPMRVFVVAFSAASQTVSVIVYVPANE